MKEDLLDYLKLRMRM